MKLIEDLGMQYPTEKSKKKKHFGVYECPICLIHFKCSVNNVNTGCTSKCRKCADEQSAKRRIEEASKGFSEASSIIHNNKYDYSMVEYKNNYTHVNIICKTHGVFQQRPNDHKRGNGCPACANNGFDKTKSAMMYYLKITKNGVIVYKIGITNRTIKERFSLSELENIQVIETWKFHLGKDAYKREQEIIKLHEASKYIGEPILNNGNTELFTMDILGLDTEAN